MDNPSMFPRFLPSGESAILIEFSDQISPEINASVRSMMDQVKDLPFVIDLIPAFSSLLIQYDPLMISFDRLKALVMTITKEEDRAHSAEEKVIHLIPVLYDGEDLSFVAQNAHLTEEEVINLHSSTDYLIYMLGFLPGFAYLGGLDERLHCPRLTSPREKIPAGSVGIGGKQTGIYPMASPGGWRLLGRTPLSPYDPSRAPEFLYAMGEYIRFVPITKDEYEEIEKEVKAGTYEPIIVREGSDHEDPQHSFSQGSKETAVASASTLSHTAGSVTVLNKGLSMTVQDKGRLGYQAQGFSVSGCMDMASFLEANRLVHNDPSCAEIEMLFMGGSFRFDFDTTIALTGADMQPKLNKEPVSNYEPISVHAGDILTLGAALSGRYGYLSIKGGFDVPLIMNSRSTNVKCHIGGFQGRALEQGDVIPVGDPTTSIQAGSMSLRDRLRSLFIKPLPRPISDDPKEIVTIRVLGGSQEDRFEGKGLNTLFGEVYTVSTSSDRMGYRLEGASIDAPHGVDIVSDGTVFGSIQVPSSGKPIVLLSDRQTTGGYAKIGTVIAADLPKLVQCMPGRKLRFVPCTLKEATKDYRRLYS